VNAHKAFFADVQEIVMSDENKELFDKKLTELKCAVKEYKKQ
jgi:hypothetical protein